MFEVEDPMITTHVVAVKPIVAYNESNFDDVRDNDV